MRWGTLGSGSIGVLYEGHHGVLRVDHRGAFARRTPRFTIGMFRPLGIWIRRLVTLLLLRIALSCPLWALSQPLVHALSTKPTYRAASRPCTLGFVDRACASGWLSALSGQDKANPMQKLSDLSGLTGPLSHTSAGSRYQVGGTSPWCCAGGIGTGPRDPRMAPDRTSFALLGT